MNWTAVFHGSMLALGLALGYSGTTTAGLGDGRAIGGLAAVVGGAAIALMSGYAFVGGSRNTVSKHIALVALLGALTAVLGVVLSTVG